MARRTNDLRTREFVEMNRHSFPGRPARTRSSRPSSIILGPFVEPPIQNQEQHRTGRPQSYHSRHHLDQDERIDQSSGGDKEIVENYPGGWKLASITVALCMAIFLVALPIGAVTTVVITLFFKAPKREISSLSLWQKVNELDIIGTLAFLPAIICLLIGLQWGGTRYHWANARIVVLLVSAGLLTMAFIGLQIWKQEKATVPPRILKQRSIAAGTWYSFWLGAAYFLLIYYLPIWFQAVKGVSATQSGVQNLPLIMAHVISALLAGGLITLTGYYTPFMLISSVLVSLGTGFLTTFNPSTGHSKWIGYQALFGLGSGLGMNQPLMAAQTVLPLDDVSIGTALVIFAQTLGGAIFVSAAENIFTNNLLTNLRQSLPSIDPAVVLAAGATQLRKVVEAQGLGTGAVGKAVEAYSGALAKAWQMATGLACLTLLGAAAMEWRSVKGEDGKGKAEIAIGG
ncbi:MAG: hypothetical protein Q9212_002797 [Teloschistes hypoglaucus]